MHVVHELVNTLVCVEIPLPVVHRQLVKCDVK